MADAIARTRTGWGASRANVMAELIVERLTGVPQDTYINGAMQHGIDTEPEARIAYEFWRNVEVVEVGLIRHPSIPDTHASPDGLIGDDGLLEIKVSAERDTPGNTARPVSIPGKYVTQIQWQCAATGRQWCDLRFLRSADAGPCGCSCSASSATTNGSRSSRSSSAISSCELDEKLERLRELYVEPLLVAG